MKKILMMSGDPAFFERKENAIDRRNVRVFACLTFEEALELASMMQFDLIILNYAVSDKKPSAIFEEVKKIEEIAKCPIIMIIKEFHEKTARALFKELPSVFIVPFPISFNYLLELSKKLLKQSQRKYVRLLVQIKIFESGKGAKTYFGFTRNISDTGMLLETETPFEIGNILYVSFMVPGSNKMIEAKAQIVRIQHQKGSTVKFYGLKFLDISPSDKEIIAGFVGE